MREKGRRNCLSTKEKTCYFAIWWERFHSTGPAYEGRRLANGYLEVLHNRVTTEDVVHTSCVRVLEHFSQVSAIDSPQTRNFVAIITKRIALTECSRMKREVPADVPTELENFDDLHETPVVAVERRDAQTALLMEIRRLGAEDQDILMLKYDNKFTVVQIAQALNMDAQVVKKRLQRIRARLKSALEEKGYDTI